MSISRLTLLVTSAFLAITIAMPAYAQLAPTPKKAPRTPVKSHTLPDKTPSTIPSSRILSGNATVLDTERLRLRGFELRLFGVVPPKMGAPLGPQTRTVLDALAKGTVTCQIKDREQNGDYLATCSNESNADFGIELLRRGLAVASRSKLQATTLAQPYLASERAAQKQRLGLWQTKIPVAASTTSIKQAEEEAAQAKKEVARLIEEKKAAEARAKSLRDVTERAAPTESETTIAAIEDVPRPQVKPSAPEDVKETAALPLGPAATTITASQKLVLTKEELKPTNIISLGPAKPEQATAEPATKDDAPATLQNETLESAQSSWLEKNQIFATGLLFLLSSLVLAGSHLLWRRRESRNELSAMAAALRGELMAARSICKARMTKWNHIKEDEPVIWPRIRVMVFQAYLSKLGMLGAALSRQLASIYGQASDFASYYNQKNGHGDLAAKKQALQTLLDHIEEVMPLLSKIEITGVRPVPTAHVEVKRTLLAHLPKKKMPPTDGGTPKAITSQKKAKTASKKKKEKATIQLADLKDELMKDGARHKRHAARSTPLQRQKNKIKDAMKSVRNHIDTATENASRRLAELRATPSSTEQYIPDYANLTEEELAALDEDNFDDFVSHNETKRAK